MVAITTSNDIGNGGVETVPTFLRDALASPEEWAEYSALHENTALLDAPHLSASLQRIGMAFAAISALYGFLIVLIRAARRRYQHAHTTNSRNRNGELPHVSEWKSAYQMTNLCVNLTLGVLGIWHFIYVIPPIDIVSPSQRVEGWRELSIFAELQIGYQLWAIPVGIYLVNEHGMMLFHHLCVIIVGAMSAFFQNGSRYFTPFFYGVIEISSVPLAGLNFFKGNPELIRQYPMANQAIRLIFAVSFLSVRVVMWIPQMWQYLRVSSMLFLTCRSNKCSVGCAMSITSALGLTALQMLWATKIAQGLVIAIMSDGERGNEKKKR